MKDRNRTGRVRRIIGTGQLAAAVLLIADVVLVMLHRINAAGLAVCVAIDRGVAPRELDGRELRKLLIAEGVELDKPCDGYWEELRNQEGDLVINRNMDAIMIAPKKK